jgi:hypothetical protein
MFIPNKIVFHTYNFLPGKIDPASRKLMKTFCNKWKGKSIYQVLLMDRANKLQDVVYFSLQVSSIV